MSAVGHGLYRELYRRTLENWPIFGKVPGQVLEIRGFGTSTRVGARWARAPSRADDYFLQRDMPDRLLAVPVISHCRSRMLPP
jgi:hypothetical protein